MKLLPIFCFWIALLGAVTAMTKQQIKKTMTVMKNQCLPKVGVAESKVNKIEQGVFIEEKEVMCYIACVYKMIQVVKNNRLDADLISRQIDILYPQELKEHVKKGVKQCMPIQDKYEDFCEGVFYGAKCLYEYDPSSFVFP